MMNLKDEISRPPNSEHLPAYEFIANEQQQQGFDRAVSQVLDHLRRMQMSGPSNRSGMTTHDVGFYAGIDACIDQIERNFRK